MRRIWHTDWGLDEWGWLVINLLLSGSCNGLQASDFYRRFYIVVAKPVFLYQRTALA